MAPPLLTAVLTLLCLGLTAGVLALRGARRARLRADAFEAQAARAIAALTERVALLESRRAEAAPPGVSPRGPAAKSSRRFDRPGPAAPAGPTLIAVPNLAAPDGPHDAASSDLGRRFGAIWELADAGASAESIARSNGQPVGQVELIIGLKRQLGGAGTGGPRPS